MKEYKLGLMAKCLIGVPEIEAVDEVKAAGFTATFGSTYDKKEVYDLKNRCEQIGLSLDFLHAPFHGINDFWVPGLAYRPLREGIYSSIEAASEADIPVVVCHVSSGWFPPQLSDIGFSRFDDLVDFALSKNVKIAFENLRKVGNLAAIMERYEKIPEVGYCYDCGHEHCYTETVHFLELYGKRLFCTHLHDNFGRNPDDYWGDPDTHLMPFDGNIDYADMMKRIGATDYTGALTLEIWQRNDRTREEFLKTAYERARKIYELQ